MSAGVVGFVVGLTLGGLAFGAYGFNVGWDGAMETMSKLMTGYNDDDMIPAALLKDIFALKGEEDDR